MPILPFYDPMVPPSLPPSEGGGVSGGSCPPTVTVVRNCEPVTFNICSCVNQGYAPPSSWTLLMAIGGESVSPVANGSVSYNSSNETVTLNDLPESYIRPGGSWFPLTTILLNLNCTGGCNTQQLAIWDNYGPFSTNPPLIQYTPVTFTTNAFSNRCCAEDLVDVSTITTKEACDQAAADNPNDDNNIVWQCTTVQAERCTERLETTFGNGDQTDTAGLLGGALGSLFGMGKISPQTKIDLISILMQGTDQGARLFRENKILADEILLNLDDLVNAATNKPVTNVTISLELSNKLRDTPITVNGKETNVYDFIINELKRNTKRVNGWINGQEPDDLKKYLKKLKDIKDGIEKNFKLIDIGGLSQAEILRRRAIARKLGKRLGMIGGLLALFGAGSEVLAALSDGKFDNGDLDSLMGLLENEISMGGGCRVITTDENGNTNWGEPDPDMEALMRVIEDATKEQPRFRSPRSLDDIIDEYFGPDPSGPSRSRFFIPKPNSQSNMDMYDSTMTISSQKLNNQLLNNNLGSPLKSFPQIMSPQSSPSLPLPGASSWGENTGHDLSGDIYYPTPKGRI